MSKPKKYHVITNLDELKVISDPLRLQILHLVTPKARTVKQIRDIVGISSTKLYYHMGQLEEAGLVNLVETKIVSGIAEKYYRAAAWGFKLAPDLLSADEGGVDEFVSFMFDASRDELGQAMMAGVATADPEGENPIVLSRRVAYLTEKEAERFYKQFSKLLMDFSAKTNVKNIENRKPYLMFGSMFETLTPEEEESEDESNE